jgi:hypothetical protein
MRGLVFWNESTKYVFFVCGMMQVTGKAVMLDEIINYVQSLQQQVEVGNCTSLLPLLLI